MKSSASVSPAPNSFPAAAQNRFRPQALPVGVPQQNINAGVGMAAILAALAIFVRFGYLHEILVVEIGAKLYLLYVFGVPALIAVFLTGGLRYVFQGRPTYYWLGFAIWMAIAVPFSTWPGGSLQTVSNYFKVGPVILCTIAGLILNWKQCRTMMWAFAGAASLGLLTARLFQSASGDGRLGLEFGSIQNANDFAAHLLFLFPFLLWIVFSSRSVLMRGISLLAVGFGLYLILRTASRGAGLALAFDFAFFFWRGTARQRIASLCIVPIGFAILVAFVPQEALFRMRSFFSDESNVSSRDVNVTREAAGSAAVRTYLMQKGLEYSLHFPVFGVGPGEFTDYEGSHEQQVGTHGMYRANHNMFLQVASECGIPALLLFVAGIVSTFRLLNTTFREVGNQPDCQEIKNAVFCVMLSMIGFTTAAAFLSLAYSFYLPATAAMAIALARAAKLNFASQNVVSRPPEPNSGAGARFVAGGRFGVSPA